MSAKQTKTRNQTGRLEMHVTIILCTYNGAQFLEEQLESIERQEHSDWELLASMMDQQMGHA